MTPRVTIIVNPISGTGGRPEVVRRRLHLAETLARDRGLDAQICLTEHPGHAVELARQALAHGIGTVVAWGGDGTMNQVGAALAFQDAVLGLIPSGSGNGLARELRIPLAPEAAFAVAVSGAERTLDCGELDGRLFFNVAGIGLDARVAHEFAAHGLVRRGFRRYLEITARELFQYTPDEHTVVVDGEPVRTRAMLIAIANGSQYGNAARIAPDARPDDGWLDVVVVDHRPAWRALLQVPRVFLGQIARVPGVRIVRGERIEITSGRPVVYHVDGEPFVGSARVMARVHRAAIRVRVPG